MLFIVIINWSHLIDLLRTIVERTSLWENCLPIDLLKCHYYYTITYTIVLQWWIFKNKYLVLHVKQRLQSNNSSAHSTLKKHSIRICKFVL
jgi:hypothetical protein